MYVRANENNWAVSGRPEVEKIVVAKREGWPTPQNSTAAQQTSGFLFHWSVTSDNKPDSRMNLRLKTRQGGDV